MRFFKFCIVVAILILFHGGGRADEGRALEPPVRLIVKATLIGKIAPDIFEMRRSGCTVFVKPGMISPDLTHVAQLVKRGKRVAVVVDNIASPTYDNPYREPFSYHLVFSDDSRHYAFTAWRSKRTVVVQDGVEVQSYRGSDVGGLTFSPQNNRLAYVVVRNSHHGDKYHLVVDGAPLDTYDSVSAPLFSRDGTHMYYIARQGQENFVVKDGVQGKHYDSTIWLMLSPDGRRIAYQVDRGQKQIVVVDEKEGKEYDKTSTLQFSHDGRHVAYLARRGNEVLPVVDGIEGTPPIEKGDRPLDRQICFSPDSKHIAYLSETAENARLVIDGLVEKEYPYPVGGSLLFSPDSKRLAFYVGKNLHIIGLDFGRKAASRIVADDIVNTHLSDSVCSYLREMFIPNSGHPGYSLLEEHAIVVDGDGESWLNDPKPDVEARPLEDKFELWEKFETSGWHEYSSNHLAFLALRKHELFRVEVEIVSQNDAFTGQ